MHAYIFIYVVIVYIYIYIYMCTYIYIYFFLYVSSVNCFYLQTKPVGEVVKLANGQELLDICMYIYICI